MLRHERQTVAMALAECLHHSAQRQETARAGGWFRGALHGEVPEAPTPQEPGTQHFFLDDDSVPELGGSRPDRLVDVRPQGRVPRRTVEQIADSVPVVPLLHVPVPQPVDSVVDVLKIIDRGPPELVVDVPMVSRQDVVPLRAALREPQLAEHLVDVPTTPGYAFAVVAVQTLGWPGARALFEQLAASPGRDTNTGQG